MQLTPKIDLLKSARYWISFVAGEAGTTLFVGVYEAADPRPERPLPEDIARGIARDDVHQVFRTKLLPQLDWLRGEMAIRWTGGYRNWIQGARTPMEVLTATAAPEDGRANLSVRASDEDTDALFAGFTDYAPLAAWSARELRPAAVPTRPVDVVAWMTRIERRSVEHEQLLCRVARKATGHVLESSRLVDLVVDKRVIVEIKSLGDDSLAQVRAALSQLYHYRFVYRTDLLQPELLAVFGSRPMGGDYDLVAFLEDCAIAVAWQDEDRFNGTPAARRAAPWLFA